MGSESERGVPSPQEVRATLARMLASETFSRSPQLGAFLRFVVEMTLRGQPEQIKGYTIGVEALGRPSGIDPQTDPIVRVEGTRLRRTIERYYSGPGAADEVLIDLPRGSYVPSFRRRAVAARPVAAPFWSRLSGRGGLTALAIAVVVIVAVVITLMVLDTGHLTGSNSIISGSFRPGNGMPTLAVAQMPVSNTSSDAAIRSQQVVDRLNDALTRFDAINIVADPSSEMRADYLIQVSLEYHRDGPTTLRFRLEDVSESQAVWSRAFERMPSNRPPGAFDDIVVEVATTLLQPFGVIRARERVKQLASNAGDPRYRCVLEASESLRSFDPAQHRRARACLELLTMRDPGFAAGVRYLAAIYLREFLYGGGTRASDAETLERALRTARRALELQPESSRGYHTLASVLLARGDVAGAISASDRAVALNRYDLAVLGDYGGRLIAAGEIERGMALLHQAVGAGAVRPSTQLFHLFVGSHMRGERAAAAQFAGQITSNSYSLGLLARALAAAESGDQERARHEAGRLIAVQRAWRDDPRGQLEKFFPSRDVVDRLARGLASVGLGSLN